METNNVINIMIYFYYYFKIEKKKQSTEWNNQLPQEVKTFYNCYNINLLAILPALRLPARFSGGGSGAAVAGVLRRGGGRAGGVAVGGRAAGGRAATQATRCQGEGLCSHR